MEPKTTDLDRTEPNGTGILPVRFPLALPIPSYAYRQSVHTTFSRDGTA